jgi:CRP/FNR family transcriptional regulator, cyclic AMP receptor protein
MHMIEQLRRIPIFADLTETHRAALAANVISRVYPRGVTIFSQGSAGEELFLIARGQVRIYTVSETGHELSVTILCEGDFFGELALLDGGPRSASAVTMQTTSVLIIGRQTFLSTVRSSPELAVAILETLGSRLRLSTLNAEHLAVNAAPQRVVRQLVELADRYGVPEGAGVRIDVRLTQDDLASLSGTTRETVNRVLASLRDQGLIRVARARVSVLDLRQLQEQLL